MALEHLHDCGIIHADLKPVSGVPVRVSALWQRWGRQLLQEQVWWQGNGGRLAQPLPSCRPQANVLLQDSRADTRGFTALVSDFGLSHLLTSGSKLHFSQNAHGTTSYL